MYCQNCGNEIHDEAVVCIHCGAPTQNGQTQSQQKRTVAKTNGIAIAGFILSFFVAIAGLICAIIGLHRANKELDGSGRGLAIAGIVISCLSLLVGVIILALYGTAIIAGISMILFGFIGAIIVGG